MHYHKPSLQCTTIVLLWVTSIILVARAVALVRWLLVGLIILHTAMRAVGGFDTVELALHSYMLLDNAAGGKLRT